MTKYEEMNTWQELWLVFAQAWLPPLTHRQCHAMQDCLAEHLTELLAGLGVTATQTELLQAQLSALPGEQLLVHYSRLFLAPPVAASLNLGQHVDGGTGGFGLRGQQMMQRLGVQQSETLQDTADHLALQLELLAHLEARQPGDQDLHREQLARLITGVRALSDMLRQRVPDAAYLTLAALLLAALQTRAACIAEPAAEPVATAQPGRTMPPDLPFADPDALPLDDPRLLAAAAARGVSAEAMQFMLSRLQDAGLETSHLLGASKTAGWQSMTPPSVRGHGRGEERRE